MQISLPCTCNDAPVCNKRFSVWLRVGTFSVKTVSPSAKSPAKSTALFTCAEGTSDVTWHPERREGSISNSIPFPVANLAPNCDNGCKTLAMGRRERDWSPTNLASTPSPAQSPAKSRAVVPLLLQSRTVFAVGVAMGTMCAVLPEIVIFAPSFRKQRTVDITSLHGERFLTRHSPSAIAAKISALWERDLSPQDTLVFIANCEVKLIIAKKCFQRFRGEKVL